MKTTDVTIVGAGLAGVECANQIIQGGFSVTLIDKKPERFGAYELPTLAELVCSNSLKSNDPTTASGLLKREMRALGSLVLQIADAMPLRAGGALAVDRQLFSQAVTQHLKKQTRLVLQSATVETIPVPNRYTVVASGPLTKEPLATELAGDGLHFFDATAPIVSADSIDLTHTFAAGRYDKGGADYLNCPLTQEAYEALRDALRSGDVVATADYDDKLFQHCQPVERLAARGDDTLRFGPLRPIGLKDPQTGRRPYAVVQLRRENKSGSMWGLVGFQTRLTWPEQKRIFRLIPALQSAEFLRYGVMHKNTFVHGPSTLQAGNEMKAQPGVFLAGQLTGVEGYMESAASGLLTGRFIRHLLEGRSREAATLLLPNQETIIGALHDYVIHADTADYQPMNANFGLLPVADAPRKKEARRQFFIERSDREMARLLEALYA